MAETLPERYYHHRIASTPSPAPTEAQSRLAASIIKKSLPPSSLPFQDAQISPRSLKDHDLIIPSIGASISPLTRDSTDPQDMYAALVSGPDVLEPSPDTHGLDPTRLTALVRNNLSHQSPDIRSRLIHSAIFTRGEMHITPKTTAEATAYLDSELAPSTTWLAIAALHLAQRLDAASSGKILTDQGGIQPNIAKRTTLINAANGVGTESIINAASQDNLPFPHGVIDAHSPHQAAFVADILTRDRHGNNPHPITDVLTVNGACAASGVALAEAQIRAASCESPAEFFFIGSAFDGPSSGSQRNFEIAGIPASDAIPYVDIRQLGYIEAQAANALFVTTLAGTHTAHIPLEGAFHIRAFTHQDTNKWGIAHPEIFKRVFGDFYCYHPDFSGTILVLTHGVPTLGQIKEIDCLKQAKSEVLPDSTLVVTSTARLAGHPYAVRFLSSVLAAIHASNNDLAFGIAPANLDLSIINQEPNQSIRRSALAQATDSPVLPQPIDFYPHPDPASSRDPEKMRSRLAVKAANTLTDLERQKIHLAYSPVTLPPHTPWMVFHYGLGGVLSGAHGQPLHPDSIPIPQS